MYDVVNPNKDFLHPVSYHRGELAEVAVKSSCCEPFNERGGVANLMCRKRHKLGQLFIGNLKLLRELLNLLALHDFSLDTPNKQPPDNSDEHERTDKYVAHAPYRAHEECREQQSGDCKYEELGPDDAQIEGVVARNQVGQSTEQRNHSDRAKEVYVMDERDVSDCI